LLGSSVDFYYLVVSKKNNSMATVNLFSYIEKFLTFEPEDFYFLQVIQRRKENPQMRSNSRIVKSYYIKSSRDFQTKQEEIIDLCEKYNARATLRLNKRNWKDIAFEANIRLAKILQSKSHAGVKNMVDSVIGSKPKSGEEKLWLVDIDPPYTEKDVDEIGEFINQLRREQKTDAPEGVVHRLKTKNGFHLVTKGFNTKKFKTRYLDVEIKKDSPINVYIP
jgi:hypothetical protein